MFPLNCARARPRSGCRTPEHESQSPAHIFGLLYSQFEFIKVKSKLQFFVISEILWI
jgi:hypothetical protein